MATDTAVGRTEAAEPMGGSEPVGAVDKRPSDRPAPAPLTFSDRHLSFLLAAMSGIVMGLMATLRARTRGPGGDEPSYLIISEALKRYHSVNLMPVYLHRDHWYFYPTPIIPQVPGFGPHGEQYSYNSIGGPLLWLVPFSIWGRAGALGFIVVVSVLTVLNIYWFLRNLNIDRRYAFVVSAAFALGTPLLTYSSLTFVEPIGALGVAYAMRVLYEPVLKRRHIILTSFAVGALLWVHTRFLGIAALLGLFLLHRIYREFRFTKRSLYAYAIVPAFVLIGLYETYTLVVWETLNPAPNQTNSGNTIFQISPLRPLVGILLDQEVGLLINFPLFVLAISGFLLTLNRRLALLHTQILLLVVPYAVLFCTFGNWHGAFSPAARLITVVLPPLSFYIAAALQRAHNPLVTTIAGAGTLVGLALTVFGNLAPRDWGFNEEMGFSQTLRYVGGLFKVDPTPYLPSSFVHHGQRMLFVNWATAFLAVALIVWLIGLLRPRLDLRVDAYYRYVGEPIREGRPAPRMMSRLGSRLRLPRRPLDDEPVAMRSDSAAEPTP